MRLQLYLFRQVAVGTALVIGVITATVWVILSLRVIELALNTNAPFALFMHLLLATVPTFLPMVLPIGVLLGILFVYNRLNQDSELIVMRAAGRGSLQLALPAMAFAGLVMLLGFAVTLLLAPAANQEISRLQQTMRAGLGVVTVREGTFTDAGPNITVYVRERTESGDLRGLFVHDRRNQDEPVVLVAASGQILGGDEQARIIVRQGTRQAFDRKTGRTSQLSFDTYVLDLARPPEQVRPRTPDARERDSWSLLSQPIEASAGSRLVGRLRVELHQRLALPLLVPALGVLALTLLLTGDHDRRGRSRRMLLASALAIAVQGATLGLLNLGQAQPALVPLIYLPALLAASSPFATLASRRLRRPVPA